MTESPGTLPDIEARIRQAEVDLLYSGGEAGYAVSLLNGAVAVFVLWTQCSGDGLSLWFGLLACATVARLLLIRSYRRANPGTQDTEKWARRFSLSSAAGGLVWGILGGLLFPDDSVAHQMFIGFILAGLAAGAVAFFSAVPSAYFAFVLTALVPFAVRLLAHGGELAVSMGVLTFLFLAALILNARRIHQSLHESFKFRFHNDKLRLEVEAEGAFRRQAETNYQRAEEEQRRFFELSLDMLAILDQQGNFWRVNPAWEASLGLTSSDFTSRPFCQFLHPDDRQAAAATALFSADGQRSFENRFRCADGSFRWLSWSVSRNDQKLVNYCVARDVTARRAVDRAKDEFISSVSHELRTPLTAISGLIRLTQAGAVGLVDEEAREALGVAQANCDRLMRLVNDILDFDKMASDSNLLQLETSSPESLVECALQELAPVAKVAEISLRTRLTSTDSLRLDPSKITRVLTHLISNAIKFSTPGSEVKIQVSPLPAGGARFAIEDAGTGIADADIPRLFRRFQQLDSSDSRSKGGIGLGLALSKEIVEQHGGQIGVHSQLNKGSIFWFELPGASCLPGVDVKSFAKS